MPTERASQVRRFSVYRIWFILRRRYFGNWNNLTAVRAINCDVPLIVLDAFHGICALIPDFFIQPFSYMALPRRNTIKLSLRVYFTMPS